MRLDDILVPVSVTVLVDVCQISGENSSIFSSLSLSREAVDAVYVHRIDGCRRLELLHRLHAGWDRNIPTQKVLTSSFS